jgi:hypothetical protein
MLYRVRRSFAYWKFDRAIAGIFDTPPIQLKPAPWTIVSMVAPKHIGMYLLSLKAFYRRVGAGQVVAIVDRDTPQASLDTLKRHIQGIELQVLEDIDVGPCQRGGTWERIIYCLERSEREFVVQVDADAFACGEDVAEVLACMKEGRSFTLADAHQIVSMETAAKNARAMDGNYIGTVAEREFDRYPGHENLLYVRGSSGLAGFAKGAFPRKRIEEFHIEGEKLVGRERWREWGTEQCASNFAVANSPGAIVLPFPVYASYIPGRADPSTKMFHFIGSYRFDDGFFARLGQAEIARLKSGPTRQAA